MTGRRCGPCGGRPADLSPADSGFSWFDSGDRSACCWRRSIVSKGGLRKPPLAVELTDDGYIARGDIEALKKRTETEWVLDQLSSEEATSTEIAEATKIPEATVRRRLGELHEDGLVERVGKGRKGSPFAWKMLSATADPLVAERKTGLIEGMSSVGSIS